MKVEIKKIYDAHIAFELEQFKGKNLKANIKEEIDTTFVWFEKVKLNDIATAKMVFDWQERNVETYKISAEQKEYVKDLLDTIHQSALKNKHKATDFISEDTYKKLVDVVVSQHELREDLIDKIVNNPFYAQMISDTIYNGIKSFMQQSGPSNETVGGSLFNIGKGLLGAALSGVQDNIDKTAKKFIQENIKKALAQNEQYLKDNLSDEKIKLLAATLWDKADEIKIKDIAKKINLKNTDKALNIGDDLIENLIASEPIKELNEKVIEHFFDYCGNKTIATLLKDNGIDKKKLIKDADDFVIPIIEKATKDGFLQERIEARLGKFYSTL